MKAINLLPTDLRGAAKSAPKAKAAGPSDEPGGIAAFVVLGALAACVAALAVYVLTTNTVKDRQAQLDAVTAEATTANQRVAELKPYADFQQMAETRIQTVKDLATSRFDWEQALRDISRVVPGDVTLAALNGTIASGAAGGGSTVRSAIAAPAVELKGCTTSQKSVATLLSRLRSVDGVTRVSLSKSAKPAQTAPGTAAAAPIDQQDLCPGTRAPAFEVVAFFERSKVPPSVEDITVQTAAAAGQQGTGTTSGTQSGTTTPTSGGVTTPPADPATAPTATPTPQAGGTTR